jgi:Protein of unknown function (DUF1569)
MSEINTSKAARRKLRFNSIDDVLAEIDRIEQADRDGALRTTGNWTPGQIMAHIASWIEYGYDGYPIKKPFFLLRWILRLMLKKMLREGMHGGVRIPGVPGGTVGMDAMAISEAAERLRNAFHRLKRREQAFHDSPAFGPMSHDDRIVLNLRHAELHLGYLDYPSS